MIEENGIERHEGRKQDINNCVCLQRNTEEGSMEIEKSGGQSQRQT